MIPAQMPRTFGQGGGYYSKWGGQAQPQPPAPAAQQFYANPQTGSVNDYYRQFTGERNTAAQDAWGWGKNAGNLPPWLAGAGNTLGLQGAAQLGKIFQDPYSMPQGMLRDEMGGAESAYQVARQRIGNDTLGSGAAEGGVAHGMRGNVELARGAGMADALRKYDQYRTALGDERMSSLWLPLQQMYLGGTAGGAPQQQKKKSPMGGILGAAGGVIGGIYGGPAGAAAGSAIGSGVGGLF